MTKCIMGNVNSNMRIICEATIKMAANRKTFVVGVGMTKVSLNILIKQQICRMSQHKD